jgi:conjugative relaxase-like TrwC/TraI family protein
MRVISAGEGYRYLLRSVVAGDGKRDRTTPLVRYYEEAGTPPGRWLGRGVSQFGDGRLRPGSVVGESQLQLLLGMGRDPVTGAPLGRPYPVFAPGSGRHAVAGFDLTFSVPKSVSVLWGLADPGTQAWIVEAHHAAVADVIDLLEREVAATRIGATGPDGGAVAQMGVVGVAAAAYDHWDSRAGDPQLHTHVVVSNKVKTLHDGVWRSLDSKALHGAVVALSEHYNAVLADRLTGTFGLTWEPRARGADRSVAWEITGVPDPLIAEFASRSRDIDVVKDRLIEEYVTAHGRQPSRATVVKLRAQATLATRPDKQIRSLEDLTTEWRNRAARLLHRDPAAWSHRVLANRPPRVLTAADVPDAAVTKAAARVVGVVSEKRSTWRYWNLWAEASRQTMRWRFATAADRETTITRIVQTATSASVRLTPPELTAVPELFRRPNGTSRFRPAHGEIYSSRELLAAEDRLLARAKDTAGPRLDPAVVAAVMARPVDGRRLDPAQAAAVARVATSGRVLDLLVGPAGAGKTTALRALHDAWTAVHGAGSVVGLASSAAAAQVLAADLGVPCENTAKWLHDHARSRTQFRSGQLVIVDEATLAGTHTLDRITGLAHRAGAKVLLVGDHAQLQSVDAGGAFNLLVSEHPHAARLEEVHRFANDWEKHASLALREGDVDVLDVYEAHGRIRGGGTYEMLDAAYTAWRTDTASGRSSLLIADSASTVQALNERARADRILTGQTRTGREAVLVGGSACSAGDLVITRRNDRTLTTDNGRGWVRNGDRWHVRTVNQDGSLEVHHPGRDRISVVLPAVYVAEHVELGYAVTVHRAQGMTVDTAHVLATPVMTREAFYVAMTRGRHTNTAYVALDAPHDGHTPPVPQEATPRVVLTDVLRRSGTDLSAHQVLRAEQDRWGSVAQLAAEQDTVAAVVDRDRWVALLHRSGLDAEQVAAVLASDAFGPLCAALRRAEATGHHADVLVRVLVGQRTLLDADDIAAVLHHRVVAATDRTRRPARRAADSGGRGGATSRVLPQHGEPAWRRHGGGATPAREGP